MAPPARWTHTPLASPVMDSGGQQPGPNAVHLKAGRMSAFRQQDERRLLADT